MPIVKLTTDCVWRFNLARSFHKFSADHYLASAIHLAIQLMVFTVINAPDHGFSADLDNLWAAFDV